MAAAWMLRRRPPLAFESFPLRVLRRRDAGARGRTPFTSRRHPP